MMFMKSGDRHETAMNRHPHRTTAHKARQTTRAGSPPWRSPPAGTSGHTPAGASYDAYQAEDHPQPWFSPPATVADRPGAAAGAPRGSTSSSGSSSANTADSRRALRTAHRAGRDREGSDSSLGGPVSILVAFTFVIEILILIGLAIFEYYLRATNKFPVRQVTFICNDADIAEKTGKTTFSGFAYSGEVPYEAVIIISFCLPPFIISVSELVVWYFSMDQQKTIRLLCSCFRLPQPFRRILRFTGTFLFGLLMTMIFVDVTKLMTGRLRPTFLDTCKPNMSLCDVTGSQRSRAENVCMQTDQSAIRDARLSFPSLQAAVTAFSACFVAIYVHNVICAGHKARILRPFLALGFLMMSVLCCLDRYGLRTNHWVDVAVGFGLGIIFAIYIGSFVLNNFTERLSGRRLFEKLHDVLLDSGHVEILQQGDWTATTGGNGPTAKDTRNGWLGGQAAIIIPRPRLLTDEGPTSPRYARSPSTVAVDFTTIDMTSAAFERPPSPARVLHGPYEPAIGGPAVSYRHNAAVQVSSPLHM